MRRKALLPAVLLATTLACRDDAVAPTLTLPEEPRLLLTGTGTITDDYAANPRPVHGAIFTTLPFGQAVNANVQYTRKIEVYLDGGPRNPNSLAAGLNDGLYVFQITDPPGKNLLSQDPARCRVVQIKGGVILGTVPANRIPGLGASNDAWGESGQLKNKSCHVESSEADGASLPGQHDTNVDSDLGGGMTVQMMPFLDTPNPGGVYKAWITPLAVYVQKAGGMNTLNTVPTPAKGQTTGNAPDKGFANASRQNVKTDNFKVIENPPFIDVVKYNDANQDGKVDGDALEPGWEVLVRDPVEGGDGGGDYLTPTGPISIPLNTEVSVCEATRGDWKFSYALINGTLVTATETTFDGKTYWCVTVPPQSGKGTVAIAFGNIPPQPKIEISKTPASQTKNAGEPFAWEIVLTNTGTGTAKAATINDPLPVVDGVEYSLGPWGPNPQANCTLDKSASPNVLKCGPLDLGKGASIKATINATTKPNQGCVSGGFVNKATGDADQLSEVYAEAKVVLNCPDLRITKTPPSQKVESGSPFEWTVTLTNHADNVQDGTAYNATINDPLPVVDGVVYSLGTWSPNPDAKCEITGGALKCGPLDLAPGKSIAAVIKATTTMNKGCTAQPFVNKATGKADGTSEVYAEAKVEILCPKLQLEKTPASQTVSSGSPIVWQIKVSNTGSGKATGVQITDALPSLIGGTYTPVDAACSLSALQLTCTIGELAAGGSKSVTVTLQTTLGQGCGHVLNKADASGDGGLSAVSTEVRADITGCGQPLTPGYWKNHEEDQELPQYLGAFPVTSSGIAATVFNGMNCSSSTDQDAIGCLAGHLLATKFNFANDAVQPGCAKQAASDADTFLKAGTVNGVKGINYQGPSATYKLTPTQRSTAIGIKDKLDAYNNGNLSCNKP